MEGSSANLLVFPREIRFNQFSFSLAVQSLARFLGSLQFLVLETPPHTMGTCGMHPEELILWVDWCQLDVFLNKGTGLARHLLSAKWPVVENELCDWCPQGHAYV